MKGSEERCPVSGKVMFTRRDIDAWLASYRRTKPPRARRLRSYLCPSCQTFHLTKHQSRGKR